MFLVSTLTIVNLEFLCYVLFLRSSPLPIWCHSNDDQDSGGPSDSNHRSLHSSPRKGLLATVASSNHKRLLDNQTQQVSVSWQHHNTALFNSFSCYARCYGKHKHWRCWVTTYVVMVVDIVVAIVIWFHGRHDNHTLSIWWVRWYGNAALCYGDVTSVKFGSLNRVKPFYCFLTWSLWSTFVRNARQVITVFRPYRRDFIRKRLRSDDARIISAINAQCENERCKFISSPFYNRLNFVVLLSSALVGLRESGSAMIGPRRHVAAIQLKLAGSPH